MSVQNAKAMAITCIAAINRVEGFDPTPLAVEYPDQGNGTMSKRLPVMVQLAWFRLRYPDGRIAITVTPEKEGFVAKARIYKDYQDLDNHFIAEADAFREPNPQRPMVSAREWAQTAAVGIALRNAGFGLQFSAAGDTLDSPFEGDEGIPTADQPQVSVPSQSPPSAEETAPLPTAASAESPLELAMKMPCPIGKYEGKTLGDVLMLEPNVLVYIANNPKGRYDPAIVAGALLICDHALQMAG